MMSATTVAAAIDYAAGRPMLIVEGADGPVLYVSEAGQPITDGDDVPLVPPVPAAVWQAKTLDLLKASLKAEIDAKAEIVRLRYITPGAGQAMTYWEKASQAKACLAAVDPDPQDYRMLAAEIGITGATLLDVASAVMTAYQQWLTVGTLIEAARRGGNVAVEAAETAEAAQAACAAVIWPEIAP